MAAPLTGELQLRRDQSKSPEFVDVDFTAPQSSKYETSLPPSASSWGKRRKSTPVRYGFSPTATKKKNVSSKRKRVARDSASMGLSYQEESLATESLECPPQSWPAMLRAMEFQSSLGTEHPSFIRVMGRKHVTTGFWLGLPLKYCRIHLPKTDASMVIEDENGKQYNLKYVALKKMLSAGWRNFAVEHILLEGDLLVFHLVEPRKFKVYIFRVNGVKDVDGAHDRQNLEVQAEETTSDNNKKGRGRPPKTKKSKYPKSLQLTELQKKQKMSTPPPPPPPQPQANIHPIEHSGNDSEEVGSEVLEVSRPSKPHLSFQEVKSFEDFTIVVNGRCIDSELPDDVRMNYYKLCIANEDFLHDAFLPSMYYKLVAGMIGQTVSIAIEMKNCRINTTKEEFEMWDNTLKSFQHLGMKVGFLRDRAKALEELAFASEDRLYVKRYMEAKNELKRVDDEIEKAERKVMEMKEISRKFKSVTGTLKEKADNYELKFKQEVDALW